MLYWVVLFVLGEVLFGRIPMALIIIIAVGYTAVVCNIVNYILIILKKYCRFGNKEKRHSKSFVDHNRRLLIIGVIFFVFGVVCGDYYDRKCQVCDLVGGDNTSFIGVVYEKQVKYDDRYRIRVSSLNGRRIAAYIIIETEEMLYPGVIIKGSGKVRDFMRATNPGQFDQVSYERSKGNMLFLESAEIYSIKSPVIGIRNMLDRIKNVIDDQYDNMLDDEDSSLAKAMVLGEKSELDQDIKALYQRNGIAHLIAISGLHIAMLGGTFYRMIRRLSGSYPEGAVCGIVFIVMYGILTGLSGATVRAMIMLIMSIIADVLGRRYDALSAIAVALLLMLIVNPGQITQAGFLLSFGAVIGIACVYPVIRGEDRDDAKTAGIALLIYKLWDGIIVSISVQLVIMPILLYNFYEIPVYGVILNIVVVPLMSVLLGALILLAISGCIESGMAGFMSGSGDFSGSNVIVKLTADISDWIFYVYKMLCKLTESLPFHNICVGRPDKWWIILYYILLIVTLLILKSDRKRYIAMTAILWVFMIVSFIIPDKLLVNMFDVGQGDGIYVRTPEHKSIIIDGGSSSKKNVGTYILKNGIKYYGTDRIDYMIATHSDADHYSGLLELLSDPGIGVDNFVLPAITNPDESYKKLVAAAEQKGCRIYYMKSGDILSCGKVTFYCLNPDEGAYADKNRGSIVLWMRYGNFDMLFTGDMDVDVENRLLSNEQFMNSIRDGNDMEVLKVAHHGSATASSKEFLENMDFAVSLVSVGENNRYGHPAPEVMERLRMYGGYIYLTKDSGAITIRSDGSRYSVSQYRR